jgi:hypothetical protein
MTRLGKARAFNTIVAIAAVLAWITGTNHCVLGLIKEPCDQTVSVSHCPGHSNEAGRAHDGASGMLACCQGLLSSNFEVAKANVPAPVLVAMQLFVAGAITLPEGPASVLPSTEYDTGPPSVNFFVSTVLRHSLPKNAPPLVS